LSKPVQELIASHKLDAGHARSLVGLDDQEQLADLIVAGGYSVRQVEQLVRERNAARSADKPREPRSKDANSLAFEKRLTDALGLQVTLNQRGERGVLQIRFSNLDQLDDIARKLERAG
jgi:ParB family chromosome partitioning protein